jgi:hypothetical protein
MASVRAGIRQADRMTAAVRTIPSSTHLVHALWCEMLCNTAGALSDFVWSYATLGKRHKHRIALSALLTAISSPDIQGTSRVPVLSPTSMTYLTYAAGTLSHLIPGFNRSQCRGCKETRVSPSGRWCALPCLSWCTRINFCIYLKPSKYRSKQNTRAATAAALFPSVSNLLSCILGS